MHGGTDGDDAEASASGEFTAEAFARLARLAQEQAEAISHYKKMYDRSSALARIGVWECDLATEALTWTDGVYDLFDLPRGSPLERARIVELYDADSRREMERLRAAAIRDGGSFTLDILIRTPKGNERWLRLTADVEQENGRSARIFGTKQDITREKLAQEELRALQAELIHVSRRGAMGAMATTLAHELNQPLAAISNYVAGARRALNDPAADTARVDRGLAGIEGCALRAGEIIRNLRAMGADDFAKQRLFDINPLVRDAATMAMTGSSDGVAVRYALADTAMVRADPVQIQQALIAIVRNAVEAMRESPRREIEISTNRLGDEIEIRIEDSGPGIAPDMLARIFDAFVSTRPKGLGIGLAVSRAIIETHGGRIAAENRRAGGASLRITLPFAAGGQKAAARASGRDGH
jgi:C4-dicarboxylate-specific signal transduction histidine kinase